MSCHLASLAAACHQEMTTVQQGWLTGRQNAGHRLPIPGDLGVTVGHVTSLAVPIPTGVCQGADHVAECKQPAVYVDALPQTLPLRP